MADAAAITARNARDNKVLLLFLVMPDFSIGVDLGGTNLRIAAVSRDGQLLEKVTLGTKVALGRDHVITEMCDAIQRLSAQYEEAGKLLGAGIGIPGIIDMQTGTLRKSANLPGWEEYPVRAEIERRLGARVVLENDANVAALGEQWLGAARGVPNMAVVTLGTGIGGGIVLEGKIWHGMNGMAGEFGHVTIEPDGYPCGCGNHGCAEQYASASAIMRMAREAIASGEAPSLAKAASSDAEFGAKSIYNLAIQGDEHARRIFRSFGRYLGILLAGLVNVLNLDMFVIGGGVSSAWDAYAPNMFEEMRGRSLVYAATAPADPLMSQSLMSQSLMSQSSANRAGASAQTESRTERKTIITPALLGSDAGLYGAARVAAVAG
ncbi:MAG TPA: ROK family protein [Candidatus Acidoferrum sp.]|nr:ROK family protein [Candidatus Acidoferrum sp.]